MTQKKILSKQRIVAGIFIIVVILGGIFGAVFLTSMKDQPQIESFQQCASAGYPIQLSYPERCSVPGGKTFTNIR